MLIALTVAGLVAAGAPALYARWYEHQATTVAGEHMRVVADAATAYIKDNYNVVAANASPTVPAVITTAMLRSTGHLPAGFGDLNPYGQGYRALVLKPATGKLQTLIITEGGEVIKELSLRAISKRVGAEGGYVSSLNPSVAEGSYAGWQTSLAAYGVSPGAGHLATALFFQDGALVNDYLYRHTVPGKPELQRMFAPIDMNGNNVNNVDTVNSAAVRSGQITSSGRTEVGEYVQLNGVAVEGQACTEKLIGLDSAGLLLTCQSGIWRTAGGGKFTEYISGSCQGPGNWVVNKCFLADNTWATCNIAGGSSNGLEETGIIYRDGAGSWWLNASRASWPGRWYWQCQK